MNTKWEEEFDEEFLTPEGFWNKDNNFYPFKIKAFIKDQITKAQQEIAEQIIEELPRELLTKVVVLQDGVTIEKDWDFRDKLIKKYLR